MADYLVTDSELTSVANAIRTKGGTSSSLEFPTEFVTAIQDIPTGGGGGSGDGYVWQDGDGYLHLSNEAGTEYIVANLISDAYDDSATYAVGDYCSYDGDFYVCNTAISTAESWTAAHWTQVTVSDELTEIKEDIASLNSQISNLNSKVVITATLTASSYSVSASAASGYSLSSIKADMVACGYRVTSGSMSSLTSDVTITTSAGAATVACSSAPTASVTLEIYLI